MGLKLLEKTLLLVRVRKGDLIARGSALTPHQESMSKPTEFGALKKESHPIQNGKTRLLPFTSGARSDQRARECRS